MQSLSRKRKTVEAQPAASNFKYPSRCGAACFALIFIALTAATTHAQRQTPAPQRPVTPARNVQLPDALRNRVAVARPIIGKGFASIPATGKLQGRSQPLTITQRSQILQMAKSGKAQNGAGYAVVQSLAGGSGFKTIPGLASTGAAKRSAPLTDPEKLAVVQYIMTTADGSMGMLKTFTTANTNLILTPAAPSVEGKGSLAFIEASEVRASEKWASIHSLGGVNCLC